MSVGILLLEVRKHAAIRKLEWGMCGLMGQIGLILAMTGSTFSLSPAFDVIARRWDEDVLGYCMIGFSVVRFLVLLVNGTKLRNSAEIRGVLSFLAFALWFTWAYDMSLATQNMAASTGLAVYGWLAAFELLNVAQASADRRARKLGRRFGVRDGSHAGPH